MLFRTLSSKLSPTSLSVSIREIRGPNSSLATLCLRPAARRSHGLTQMALSRLRAWLCIRADASAFARVPAAPCTGCFTAVCPFPCGEDFPSPPCPRSVAARTTGGKATQYSLYLFIDLFSARGEGAPRHNPNPVSTTEDAKDAQSGPVGESLACSAYFAVLRNCPGYPGAGPGNAGHVGAGSLWDSTPKPGFRTGVRADWAGSNCWLLIGGCWAWGTDGTDFTLLSVISAPAR